MPKAHLLKGAIQDYSWGGKEFILNLLQRPVEGKTIAEYWLGAHSKAPSKIDIATGHVNLIDFIRESSSLVLGKFIAAKFGRLPFLFKVLDVKDMLSIQVHPTKSAAEKGFSLENQQGIPMTASHRNYKDDNHKPEIMVALSDFWLLHGFLPKEKLEQVLTDIPEFRPLIDVFNQGSYLALYETVMTQTDAETRQMLEPLILRVKEQYHQGFCEKSSPDYWAAKAVLTTRDDDPIDKGIFSIYFFNLLRLKKGESIFQAAGIPHAYLEGQNIELMANSDNVLRAGLTPKHVDIPELLKHVNFEEVHPHVFQGELLNDGLESVYRSPAPDFELSQISISENDEYTHQSSTAQVLLLMEGEVTLIEDGHILECKKGEAIFVSADCDFKLKSNTHATLYKATAPTS